MGDVIIFACTGMLIGDNLGGFLRDIELLIDVYEELFI